MLLRPLLAVGACSTTPVPTTTEAYTKALKAGRSLWYHLTTYYNNLLTVGKVEAHFDVPATGGTVRNIRIVSNTGNPMDEVIVIRAIQKLHAPPIPPGLLESRSDYLTLEETFTIFQNP